MDTNKLAERVARLKNLNLSCMWDSDINLVLNALLAVIKNDREAVKDMQIADRMVHTPFTDASYWRDEHNRLAEQALALSEPLVKLMEGK